MLKYIFALLFAGEVLACSPDLSAILLREINNFRAEGGHCGGPAEGSLNWNPLLERSAQLHTDDMAKYHYFSHTGRDGSQPWDRMSRVGYQYSYAGENLASASNDPYQILQLWKESPSHCRLLLDSHFIEAGIGCTMTDRNAYLWALNLATPK